MLRFCTSLIILTPCISFSTTPQTILVLGDSLSAGYGLPTGKGYISLLTTDIQKSHQNTSLINASISGDTSSGGKQRFPALIDKYHPNILMLELGANDALRGIDIKYTEKNLSDILELAKANHMKTVLIGIQVPSNYGVSYNAALLTMYQRLSKKYATALVPFLLEGFATNRSMFQEDGIHPNEKAQEQMLRNVSPTLMPLLNP